jgi:ankyrin repeat protein
MLRYTGASVSARVEPDPDVLRLWSEAKAMLEDQSSDDAKALENLLSGPNMSLRYNVIKGSRIERSKTLLHYAAKNGRIRCLELLLSDKVVCAGTFLNIQDPHYRSTALGLAAFAGKRMCVEALLAKGADPRIRNKYGENAADAAAKKHKDLSSRLRQVIAEHSEATAAVSPHANPNFVWPGSHSPERGGSPQVGSPTAIRQLPPISELQATAAASDANCWT